MKIFKSSNSTLQDLNACEYVHDHKHKNIMQSCYTMQYKTQE